MKVRQALVIMIFFGFFFSCQRQQNDLSKKIIGDWQLVNFSTNQKIQNPQEYRKAARQLIMTTALIIRHDGTIKSIIWGTTENGRWNIKKNELLVYGNKKKTHFRATIIKLTDTQLLLYQHIGKVKILLYFKKFD